jgi:hypothetical protein
MNRNLRILAEGKGGKDKIYQVYVIDLDDDHNDEIDDFDFEDMEEVYSGPDEDKANAIADKYEKKGYYIEIYVKGSDEPLRGG